MAGLIDRWQIRFALLIALPFIVYSNNYHHEYHLDDAYTIQTNTHLRSLSEIPRFFVDPSTYGSLREQADYRPILLTTYALNYWMGGYETWWWHFTQILLHIAVTIGLYFFCRRILIMNGDDKPDRIALFVAVIFAIHPANSGVVNYLNARSSLLTAAFLLPALLAYMKPVEEDDYDRPQWWAALFFGLALFTKVEAVGVLGAFWAYELWQRGRESPTKSLVSAIVRSFDRRTWIRLAPALVISIVYLVIRTKLMAPFPFAEARHAADVGPYQYILTQVTAWWYYLLRWVAPVKLVSDDLAYPVYRSFTNPIVLLALGGWILVATFLIGSWKRAPYLLFLALAALALISPTSSFAPLAEMVNEHRPYLPIGLVSIAFLIPLAHLARRFPATGLRTGAAAGCAVVLTSLALLTYHRNEAFSTDALYWKDVIDKAPSSRAYLNYGRTLAAAGNTSGALHYYRQSLELAPNWYFTQNNMAISFWRAGQLDSARFYFDRGVATDRFDGAGLTARGEFRVSQRQYALALEDFRNSLPISLERYRNLRGLATAYAGLGDVENSFETTKALINLDKPSALVDIATIAGPYFREPNLHARGVTFYQKLAALLPAETWIAKNIATLENMPQDTTATASSAAVASSNGDTTTSAPTADPSMKRGLDLLYRDGDPVQAAGVFRKLLSSDPQHLNAAYQLAIALDNAGRQNEARTVWETVLRLAADKKDQRIQSAAEVRLQRSK